MINIYLHEITYAIFQSESLMITSVIFEINSMKLYMSLPIGKTEIQTELGRNWT